MEDIETWQVLFPVEVGEKVELDFRSSYWGCLALELGRSLKIIEGTIIILINTKTDCKITVS